MLSSSLAPNIRGKAAILALSVMLVGPLALATPRWSQAATPHRIAKRTNHPTRGRHAPAKKKVVVLERHVAATRGGLPNIQALGAVVLDDQGHELYARNADQERPIASISKLAATLVVADRGIDLDGLSTITKADIEVARGGARSRLLEGMTLSNRDLLHAALMGSDNRAIPTLGRAVKLGPTQLAAEMTAKAKSLGLKHTRFHDPTGLSTENVSTPRETIALLRAVIQNPVLGPIVERVQYEAHPVGRPPIVYNNTYRPAIRKNVQVLGGKTGYNDEARYCLVLAAKVDGQTCYMSFLSNEGKLTRFGDVARVADWMVSRKPKPPSTSPPAAGPPAGTSVLAAGPAAQAPAPVMANTTAAAASADLAAGALPAAGFDPASLGALAPGAPPALPVPTSEPASPVVPEPTPTPTN